MMYGSGVGTGATATGGVALLGLTLGWWIMMLVAFIALVALGVIAVKNIRRREAHQRP